MTLGLLHQGTIYEILRFYLKRFSLIPPTPRWIISLQTLTTHEHWVFVTLSRPCHVTVWSIIMTFHYVPFQ
jgi:hypothetical protein